MVSSFDRLQIPSVDGRPSIDREAARTSALVPSFFSQQQFLALYSSFGFSVMRETYNKLQQKKN